MCKISVCLFLHNCTLQDRHDESDDREQSGQCVLDLPLYSIGEPIGRQGIDCPLVDRFVHRLIENKEVGEHRDVTDCRDEVRVPRPPVMPSQPEQREGCEERQDFYRPEHLSPVAIEMLLHVEP
jgi:hypothetical protein